METIGVSEHVKERLEDIKDGEQHTSFDSVIRTLLHEYDADD